MEVNGRVPTGRLQRAELLASPLQGRAEQEVGQGRVAASTGPCR